MVCQTMSFQPFLTIYNNYRDLFSYNNIDIDECSPPYTSNCEQICMNTEGSYECGCHSGYQLDENGMNCTGK